MDALHWIEQARLSAFVREVFTPISCCWCSTPGAWRSWLAAVSLRVLGVARGVPLQRMRALFPVMWFGATLAAVSGIGLLAGYPAKALTNWVFALKFACLVTAALLLRHAAREAFPLAASGAPLPARARWTAGAALLLWLGGVASGKLLLYTNTMLLTTDLP